MDKLQIHISNFRAIEDAQIALNGITVLTGLNATGKSTISRMMYYAGYYANHYQELIDDRLNGMLEGITLYLLQYLDLLPDDERMLFIFKGYRRFSHKPFEEEDAYLMIDTLQKHYESGAQVKSLDRERLGKVLGKQFKNRQAFFKGLEELKEVIEGVYEFYRRLLKDRPPIFLRDKLSELFSTSKETLMKSISVREGTEEIVGPSRKDVGVFTSFDRVFYIDSPMIANFSGDFPLGVLDQNWEELIQFFYDGRTRSLSESEQRVADLLAGITRGQVVLPSKDQDGVMRTRKIYFTESSGESYAIKEVATGIKSFALIQSLLQKGLLTERTLLIIDEPEAHLHPQWTVEYARIITTLHRELGVKFLLATHSPRLVQSLSLFASEEEETAKSLLFYMSEPTGTTPVRYRFRKLTEEEGIEPIFSCFNTAYDVMNQYIAEE
ncbi:MAG: AAA family ATPase [Porphyromonas sp.]|uniref:AAA family ATPase n=2 Tax=Porphyromonas sp. TaxID=1924944 RepID=UPI002A752352|nr:AAA family ATPase [Porphyromonas sp.]MDY3112029.1 AAA family ATPase [Porphyromonas sp.]